jgi:Cytochrome c554 and c-prime
MARFGWLLSSLVAVALIAPAQETRDPAAWGSTHAGQPVPDFVHGDECLFCHRNNVGPGWQKNSHGLTVRQREDAPELIERLQNEAKVKAFDSETTHTLGSRNHVRYLRKDGYGKFDLSSFRADIGKDRKVEHWEGTAKPEWQKGKFENRCAGCHTTGIDAESKTFRGVGLDCYTCHGVVDLNHSGDVSLIFLSKKRRSDVLAITSTCAQCHLRGGGRGPRASPIQTISFPGITCSKTTKWTGRWPAIRI